MAPTFTTDRQTYRSLVAEVAARAKERLPEAVNGRVESAAKLVLLHDVTPQGDGTILVGSSTDPLKTYRLVGDTCECQDWQHGKAPQGWCQHRIAAGIHKRVGEVLAAQDAQEGTSSTSTTGEPSAPAPTPTALPEAPASVNVRVVISGYEVQWTLRDADEGRLAERLAQLLARYPKPQPQPQAQLSPQQHNALAQHKQVSGVCPIHGVQMKLNDKNGRQWWSHKTPDGWCKGRG